MARGAPHSSSVSHADCRCGTAGIRCRSVSWDARFSARNACVNAWLPRGDPRTTNPCCWGGRDRSPTQLGSSAVPKASTPGGSTPTARDRRLSRKAHLAQACSSSPRGPAATRATCRLLATRWPTRAGPSIGAAELGFPWLVRSFHPLALVKEAFGEEKNLKHKKLSF